ncbi:hypothetical protein [Pseudomonas sp. KNUC1026]|uniref:hypothetical protein n=1 Tax=Pseudomonas sp. KNUC1026 TaxID=2893890 RepID=UPI001F3BF93D|nr:hypothetical protein [Pseudomonas sp. KNUC1026]UFH50593.1 hypothetical protein LN139_05175 [Pseudomonas sp. KNUC1026]
MYAKSLHLYEFKCYRKAVAHLQYPGRKGAGTSALANVNLILGDNGGGKSSVLRALAIAALAPALLDSGFVPYRLVRRDSAGAASACLLKLDAVATDGEHSITPGKSRKLELLARLEPKGPSGGQDRLHLNSTPRSPITELLDDDYSPAFFVAGYGATRRVETADYSPAAPAAHAACAINALPGCSKTRLRCARFRPGLNACRPVIPSASVRCWNC